MALQKTKIQKKNPVSDAVIAGVLHDAKGKSKGSIELPGAVFGLPWNADLVHQVIVGMEANKRAGTADSKDRSEVRGGGRKPWQQKGTGRARHGSSRSPIWKGGGVTHGPLSIKGYEQKINKKMRAKALYVILSKKLKTGNMLFVDAVDLAARKTKDAQVLLSSLAKITGFERLANGTRPQGLVLVPNMDLAIKKSFSNLSSVRVVDVKNVSALDVMSHKYVIITHPEDSIAFLKGKLTPNAK